MTAAATILTIALAAAAASDDAKVAPLTIATEVERVPLGSARATAVRVSALTRQIFVTPRAGELGALLKALRRSRICPTAEKQGADAVLTCRSSKLDVALSEGGRALDLRQLRGLPWRDAEDGPPRFTYDPAAVGLGGGCPGDTLAGRGECLLTAGDFEEAERLFTKALATSSEKAAAALRLGDLALRRNAVASALDFYEAAGASGPFGQLAVQRRHELLGLAEKELHLDRDRVPEAMLPEVDLRRARSLAFAGRAGEAARLLAQRIGDQPTPALCAATDKLCRRLALVALTSQDRAARAEGLALYASLPARAAGALAAELAEAAADVAAELGAPLYGANALAATVSAAPPQALAHHLLRAAELFEEAGQPARRDVILEYARLRLPESVFKSGGFTALPGNAAPAPSAAHESSSDEGATKELAAARAAISAAQGSGTLPATKEGTP